MPNFRRRIFLIDAQVQGALVMRVVSYWFYCLFTISMLLIWWDLYSGPPRRFFTVISDVGERFGPVAVASLLIIPMVVMDMLRTSNRFAGPAKRLHAAICDLADGKIVRPMVFRDDDFWQKMAVDFNRLNARVERLSAGTNEPSAEVSESVVAGKEEPQLVVSAP